MLESELDLFEEPEEWAAPLHLVGGHAKRSRFLSACDEMALSNEMLVIPDDNCDEIALRALADILEGYNMPGDHGGPASVEAKVIRGSRVVFTRGAFWFYDRELAIWVEVPETVLEKRIAAYRQVQYGKAKTTYVVKDGETIEKNIYKRLRMSGSKIGSAAKVARTLVGRDKFFEGAPVGLYFQDCFLEYDNGPVEKSWIIKEKGPELRQRHTYSFSSPPADFLDRPVTDDRWQTVCPVLNHVLRTSLPGREEDWRALRQRFGLALAGMSQQIRGAHLWFVGPPGCGKSSIATAFGSLFPAENRTAVDIHSAVEWKTGKLEMSRYNVVSECEAITTPGFMKDSLTGLSSGLLEVREQGKPAMYITPRFLAVICSNGRPVIPEEAVKPIVDRFTILRFEAFKGKADPTIPAQMEAQARGLVEWALAGLYDWQVNGLIESKESELVKLSWWRSSNNVLLWAAVQLRTAEGAYIPVSQPKLKTGAFEAYLDWCEDTKIHPRNRKDLSGFRRALVELNIEVKRAGEHKTLSIVGYRLERQPEEPRIYTPLTRA